MTMQETRVGTVVDGKYEVVAPIGRGGMSRVWLARDERLRKLWAVKEIRQGEGGVHESLLRQALIDEADFLKRLDHPAIPRVVDIIDTGLTVFVVMDYVEGRSLSSVMRERGRPFSQDQVIDWGIQLCDVLSYLHRRTPPVVYRDMKPANVMLREDGTVRLIDFGIAANLDAKALGPMRKMGTPGYAAPEQLESTDLTIDPRMDVYSLGATLYTLVTGHVPERVDGRDGGSRVDFAMRPIRAWNASLSEGLEHVLLRATQRDPQDRYQTVEELRYDLGHADRLTEAWRRKQRRKVAVFRRWVVGAVACTLLGAALAFVTVALSRASYEGLMYEAGLASTIAAEGEPSDAERLYLEAMRVDPTRIEPYRRLVSVYAGDYRLTDDEDRRLRGALARSSLVEGDPAYASFCFEVGVSYLSYYRIDQEGGSVGNAAIASVEASAPWFARAIESSGQERDHDAGLSEADLRAASVYELIAEFHGNVTRAGREGRAATDEYRALWEALARTMREEATAADGKRSTEGVRARLCQVCAEVLASPTYLAGMARSGVSREDADELLEDVRVGCDDLSAFFATSENQEVYAPLEHEVRACLGVAERNVCNVYENPVALGGGQDEGSSA